MKIKTVNDYVDQVSEQFPDISKDEIKRILVYGFKMILQYVAAGNDVQIINRGFWCFIGRIPKTALQAFETYKNKLSKRIAYMFKKTNSEWDGYYYFARSESQYIEYLKQNKKKKKVFKNVFLYKLLEELNVKESYNPYIFRLAEDRTDWMSKYYPEIKTDKAELIIQRDPMNMNDLLITQNKFKYIQ